jgi:hypothetical protein
LFKKIGGRLLLYSSLKNLIVTTTATTSSEHIHSTLKGIYFLLLRLGWGSSRGGSTTGSSSRGGTYKKSHITILTRNVLKKLI